MAKKYIDADSLINYLYDYQDCDIDIPKEIAEFPTADVRENVRGEWEQVVSGWAIFMRCNQCKNAILENDFFEICRKVNYGSKLLDFCPNCGADMRGEQDDQALPSADVVEVVRCGQCKHLTADGRCLEFADDNLRPSASDYCSYGERRTDG